MQSDNRRLDLLALLLMVLAVYVQALDFLWLNFDDYHYIRDNPFLLRDFWEVTRWAFTADLTFESPYLDYWQPLTVISHAIVIRIFALNPTGHHAANLFLHGINVLLLYSFLLRTTRQRAPSFLVAALLAVHPIHAESVAWITERKDVLCFFFILLGFHAFRSAVESRSPLRWALIPACHACALMSKPMAMPVPLVLIALAFWPLRIEAGQRFRFGAVLAAMLALSLFSAASSLAGQPEVLVNSDFVLRGSNALSGLTTYPRRMLWPNDLAIFYPALTSPLSAGGALVRIAAIGLAVGAAWRFRATRPWLTLGVAWYLAMIAPTLVTAVESANRFAYSALPGLYVAIAWELNSRIRHLIAVTSIVVAILLPVAWHEIGFFSDSIRIFERALSVNENNYIAHRNLGAAYQEVGRLDEALAEYYRGVQLAPSHVDFYHRAGTVFLAKGDTGRAEATWNEGLAINPDFRLILSDLGILHSRSREFDSALPYFDQLLRINPDDAITLNWLGYCFLGKNEPETAAAYFTRAVELHPDRALVTYNLARTSAALGNASAAAGYYAAIGADSVVIRDSLEALAGLHPGYAERFASARVVAEREGFSELESALSASTRSSGRRIH